MSSSDLPKLWTTSSKFAKFVLSKSFFSIKNQPNLSDFFCKEYLTRRSTFINEIFWKLWFLKQFVFKNCAQFFRPCSKFWKVWRWHYSVIKCLFLIDAYVVWYPTWSKNLGRYLLLTFPRSCRQYSVCWNSYDEPSNFPQRFYL